MFLRKKKIKNSSAKDGAEAVEKWRTGGFHLILVGYNLVSLICAILIESLVDGHPIARHGWHSCHKRDSST